MKLGRPGKKTIALVVALAVLGGGGFGAVKYLGLDPQMLMAMLPHESAQRYLAMLGLADDPGKEPKPPVTEGEEQASAAQTAELAPSGGAQRPEDSDHRGEASKEQGVEHNDAPEKTDNGSDPHGKHAAPEIPYVAPSSLQSSLVRQVRALQAVQERLARGDKQAAREQRELLIQLGDSVSRLPVAQASLEEIYASVIYLLSGGRPDIAARFLERKDLPHAVEKLLSGSIAYVKGEAALASDDLRSLDPRQFGPSIAGHLAMIQASAVEDLTPLQRRELLELTANTMLGTLLEEAALRRLMELAAGHGDTGTFLGSANRYSRRFSNSLYNAEYRSVLLQGILKLETGKHGLSAEQLDSLVFEESAARRNDILESLARASLRGGLSNLCRYAAARLRRLSPEGSVPWHRASLYHASCSVTEGGAGAIASLKSLDARILDDEDRELLNSALILATHAALEDKPDAMAVPRLPDADTLTEDQLAFRDKVRNELASVDQIIQGSIK
jgi:chemotaxis protein MotC